MKNPETLGFFCNNLAENNKHTADQMFVWINKYFTQIVFINSNLLIKHYVFCVHTQCALVLVFAFSILSKLVTQWYVLMRVFFLCVCNGCFVHSQGFLYDAQAEWDCQEKILVFFSQLGPKACFYCSVVSAEFRSEYADRIYQKPPQRWQPVRVFKDVG